MTSRFKGLLSSKLVPKPPTTASAITDAASASNPVIHENNSIDHAVAKKPMLPSQLHSSTTTNALAISAAPSNSSHAKEETSLYDSSKDVEKLETVPDPHIISKVPETMAVMEVSMDQQACPLPAVQQQPQQQQQQKQSPGSGKRRFIGNCFKCNRFGHQASECRGGGFGGRRNIELPTPQQTRADIIRPQQGAEEEEVEEGEVLEAGFSDAINEHGKRPRETTTQQQTTASQTGYNKSKKQKKAKKPPQKEFVYVCKLCGKEGHHITTCENPDPVLAQSNLAPGYICVICKQPGHHVKFCPKRAHKPAANASGSSSNDDTLGGIFGGGGGESQTAKKQKQFHQKQQQPKGSLHHNPQQPQRQIQQPVSNATHPPQPHLAKQPTKLPLCKYIKSNTCQLGEACKFSHDLSQEPCAFFHLSGGGCHRGVECPYSHAPLSEETIQKLKKEHDEFKASKTLEAKLWAWVRTKEAETKSATNDAGLVGGGGESSQGGITRVSGTTWTPTNLSSALLMFSGEHSVNPSNISGLTVPTGQTRMDDDAVDKPMPTPSYQRATPSSAWSPSAGVAHTNTAGPASGSNNGEVYKDTTSNSLLSQMKMPSPYTSSLLSSFNNTAADFSTIDNHSMNSNSNNFSLDLSDLQTSSMASSSNMSHSSSSNNTSTSVIFKPNTDAANYHPSFYENH